MSIDFKYEPQSDLDRKHPGMEITIFWTYQLAPELKEEIDESQFLSQGETRLQSPPSDDPMVVSNYYSWYIELPFGTFRIDKVVKHKQKDAPVTPNEYTLIIEPE